MSPKRSAESERLKAYYTQVQVGLLRNELLRTDNGGADAPFGARQLAANFETIALHDEYVSEGGQYVARSSPSSLHRWSEPVRLSMTFGNSIPASQRQEDTATLNALTKTLAAATGHPISVTPTAARANFHVLVLNEDERKTAGSRLAALMPGVSQAAMRYVETMPESVYCFVLATDPRDDGVYRSAIAVIRAENPGLMRKACFHEEIAQGLGLPNDSPRARPSIFNDDEEFALLTHHDKLLLRILYDPRLTPGMTSETARPTIAQIARELMGETS